MNIGEIVVNLQAERDAAIYSLEVQAKTFRLLHQRLSDAIEYIDRHTHPGVNMAAHEYLLHVKKILTGKETVDENQ